MLTFFCFRMSAEGIAICSICQMTFNSHEEVLGHTCIDIKEEKIEVADLISDNKDIKDECDLSENDSDYSPKRKKSKNSNYTKGNIKQGKSIGKFKDDINRNLKNDGSEVILKVETNEFQDEKQNNPNLELSEQFIVYILKQVDELCENIENGDPDTKRSREINQNLNNAVNPYRNILNFGKEIFVGSEYYDEIEPENEYDVKDVFHDSKVLKENVGKTKVPKKKVKKPKLPEEKRKVGGENEAIDQEKIFPEKKKRSGPKKLTKKNYDEKFELVKNQCGKHELSSMAYMLNLSTSSLSIRLQSEGIKFIKKAYQDESNKDGDFKYGRMSFPELIAEALNNAPKGELVISDIFKSINLRHPQYKLEDMQWQKNVRGAISRNKNFAKANKANNYQQYWKFSEAYSIRGYIPGPKVAHEGKLQKSNNTKPGNTELTAECHFCEMKKNELKRDLLMPFLRFNSDKDQFECSLCNFLSSNRRKVYSHIRSIHANEINTKAIPDKTSENNQECDGSSCKKVYGRQGKTFWCKKCLQKLQLAEETRRKATKVCSECGATVYNLAFHYKLKHNQEKQICDICSQEYPSLVHLTSHRKYVHEKIPCAKCGKLFGARYMNQHIQLAHTHDDQESYPPEHKNGRNYTVQKFGKLGKRVAYIHNEGFIYRKIFKITEC